MLPLLILVLASGMLLYYYLTFHYDYWRSKGVPGPKPRLFFGNVMDVILLRITSSDNLKKMYNEYKGHPYVGYYELRTPVLMLTDPKLIKLIMIKDFAYFQNRGVVINKKLDPLTFNIINLWGPPWRTLRTKLTPTFTSVKLRNMFGLLVKTSDELKEFVGQYADREDTLECRDLMMRYTLDVIAICFFGLKINSIRNKNSEFRAMCRKVVKPSMKNGLKRLVRAYMPKAFKMFNMTMNSKEVINYILELVKDIIEYREKNNVTSNDFMQSLIQLKNDDEKIEVNRNGNGNKTEGDNRILIDEKMIAAQVFAFLFAGFDASSSTMSYVMYELAHNPEIQERLLDEVDSTLEKHGYDYEAISQMEYLDCVIRETLRKDSPVPELQRISNESYRIPNTNVIFEKGMKIRIPIDAIHHDPTYYPEPTKFDPDRFSSKNEKLREPFTFLPFGEGPRICIGMKFAYTVIKAGLVAFLADYKVTPSFKSPSSIENDLTTFVRTAKHGICLKILHRKKPVEKMCT